MVLPDSPADTGDMAAEPSPWIYLASQSPRRRELLNQLGLTHRLLLAPAPEGEDEPQWPGESGADYVCRTAREKVLRAAAWRESQGWEAAPILAADTCVILDGEVLGKPRDRAHAAWILGRLSGARHEVRTALALACGDALHEAVSITTVWMQALDAAQIGRYCDSGEPEGKAGAYGIQGRAGAFVARIDGSYTGVMGLPLHETAQLLRRAAIVVP